MEKDREIWVLKSTAIMQIVKLYHAIINLIIDFQLALVCKLFIRKFTASFLSHPSIKRTKFQPKTSTVLVNANFYHNWLK